MTQFIGAKMIYKAEKCWNNAVMWIDSFQAIFFFLENLDFEHGSGENQVIEEIYIDHCLTCSSVCNFVGKILCHLFIWLYAIVVSNIILYWLKKKEIWWPTHEGRMWDVFYEFEIWFNIYHCSAI